jgi:iron(III) transport system ATP-binding protein
MGLRIEAIQFSYGDAPAVRGVSLAVRPGEVASLLGPSGCGKSTVLRLAAGLERPRAGRVRVGGRVVADAAAGIHLPPEVRRVGLMFQDYALFPHLTVEENVTFGLRRPGPADRRRARAALARVGLDGLAIAYPHTLSGGQQQRCALLRALAPQPEVLLLDEPFSGLDVVLRAQVRADTLALLREAGIATLVVTHDPDEAMAIADHLWVMQEGAIVQDGSSADLLLRPNSAFIAGFFGPLNRLAGRVDAGAVATPLGRFAAPGLADGCPADVFIRAEGVIVAPPTSDSPAATVVEAHLIGCTSHLRLAVAGLAGPLTAVIADVLAPVPGTTVGLGTDRRHVFVFARQDDGGEVPAA